MYLQKLFVCVTTRHALPMDRIHTHVLDVSYSRYILFVIFSLRLESFQAYVGS